MINSEWFTQSENCQNTVGEAVNKPCTVDFNYFVVHILRNLELVQVQLCTWVERAATILWSRYYKSISSQRIQKIKKIPLRISVPLPSVLDLHLSVAIQLGILSVIWLKFRSLRHEEEAKEEEEEEEQQQQQQNLFCALVAQNSRVSCFTVCGQFVKTMWEPWLCAAQVEGIKLVWEWQAHANCAAARSAWCKGATVQQVKSDNIKQTTRWGALSLKLCMWILFWDVLTKQPLEFRVLDVTNSSNNKRNKEQRE